MRASFARTTLLLAAFALIAADGPVVQAVYFFSPTCPFCTEVSQQHLPPLVEEYGERLEILYVDVTTRAGQDLYASAVGAFDIPADREGVPAIIVSDVHMVGAFEIPEQLPGLIESGLDSGGVEWPDIPGIDTALEQFPLFGTEPVERPSVIELVGLDPIGNGIAIVVLGGMAASLYLVGSRYLGRKRARRKAQRNAAAEAALQQSTSWLIPLLSVVGLAISIYLLSVSLSGTTAVCGPVGDCNTVQHSEHSRLFGVVPVALIGALGFAAIILIWAIGRFGGADRAETIVRALLLLAAGGTLFSLYLTFLEPFVIGATCSWCLATAVLITAVLWLSGLLATAPAARRQSR